MTKDPVSPAAARRYIKTKGASAPMLYQLPESNPRRHWTREQWEADYRERSSRFLLELRLLRENDPNWRAGGTLTIKADVDDVACFLMRFDEIYRALRARLRAEGKTGADLDP